MAKQSPTLYSVAKTFIWFAVVSLVLTGCLVGIVMTDYNREWKNYQKKFTQLKIEKAREELKLAAQGIDSTELARFETELKAAKIETASRRAESASLQKESAVLDTKIAKAKAKHQDLKQFLDSDRYYFEEYREKKDTRSADYEKKVNGWLPRVAAAKLDLDELQKEKDAKDAKIESFSAKEKEIERSIDKLLADKTRLEKRIKNIQPSLAKDILNAPMLDFVAPTIKVQQIVLDNLQDDYHFAKVQKVDRCTTCHQGIDQKGFEDAPQPFRTHSKIELYLGSASPHPMETIGCTVCHSGSGHSVDFTNAAHTPRDENQAKEWKKKYNWHELEKWEHKMLPAGTTQSSCVKCHSGVIKVPQADQLNRGRRLAETLGCFNCHKIKGFSTAGGSVAGGENLWKVGPDLQSVGSKLSEEWIAKWLEDPANFRHSTKMPKVFNLSNTSSPEDMQKNAAAIQSIASYLIHNSEPVNLLTPPVPGNAANGEKLVKTLGCLGCHTGAGKNAADFGPELTGMGSKTSAAWIYTWVKNPKHISPETRMPDLRLSDEEASDITSYLISLRNEPFENKTAMPVKPEVVEEMILTNLQGTLSSAEARAELEKMSARDKLQYLGKKSIVHQGCFTCHAIKGFEDVKPIGAELTNEGQKNIHQFDFGFSDIPRTRHDFIRQKLKDPRLYDHGKEKAYYDKLRMPQFQLTDEEIDALTVFILSLTEEQIPLEMQKRLNTAETEIEHGRLLVSKLNCHGCHTLDGQTGVIREITEDAGQMPPILEGEGGKVQEKWLRQFLADPKPIRPWIQYRMPTFHFSGEELTVLNKYFNHLSHQELSYEGIQIPETSVENLAAGKQLFDTFQCIKCHQISQESAAMGSSFLAPDLAMTKSRLKPGWVHTWLEDPQQLEPGTMMPTYFSDGQSPVADLLEGDAKKQIDAIRAYLYRYEPSSTPADSKITPKEASEK